ncbi:two-component system, OmpR family, sensor histidine kinase ResE [Alteribacillus persepolensis]|uniref:histidine kinase n=1 Tax=Alteribacillus persepolensis TaxID=568899 RepID=A0A1G7ZLJ7_9BACI|nr:ATP-binding protein [Alteribacillus persepolensis]SDH09495.1 two-component system, OmpR family, sensor histidine kinase ResE [Alteribacillus persepolensis]
MIWRSVVGKLSVTILLLVLVVLLVLTILLLQFFERFHITEAEEQLTNHANGIVNILEEYDSSSEALNIVEHIADSYNTTVVVFQNGSEWESESPNAGVHLPLSLFREDERLSRVANNEAVITHGDFPTYENGEEIHNEIFIVGMPFETAVGETGSVFLYQSLSIIEDTTGETKQIILFSAGIAIVLTAFFAVFLSSRITAPLRKMRELALEVTKGNFETKVPVVTNDEIGQLGIAFNKMRRELNQNIMALNQEKEQLSRILTSMADGVITMDRKGTMVVTNPPANRFLQAYSYEHAPDTHSEIEHLPKEVKKLFQRVVTLEKEQMIEMDVQGRVYVVLMTPLYDKQFVRGTVAVIRDMTEERQHDKLRKDFIANVSHELRTPISMLQGYSEAIIDDIAQSKEETQEIGRIIYDESRRMGRLVNELLDLARMEAGHIQLEKQWVDVSSFLEKVYKKFQGLANDAAVDLELEQKHQYSQAYFDPDRIEQVLTNLIHNAIRHTSVDGHVKIIVSNTEKQLTIEVEDSGSGIPEEDLPYVFERFYKADKARTREKGGTGLGLAIAKNIVDSHNGDITVHSKQNEGTTFRFYLPLEKDKG